MSVIAHPQFKGEIPRLDAHLLPPLHAQSALNCEFAGGALRPLKGGLLERTMVNNPVRGIYTEDGILFYTWVAETLAWRSPIIDDSQDRMFFLQPGVGQFTVATRAQMASDGPSPSGNTWRAGVPQPTVAPVLRLVERTTLPDYPSISIAATAWWESGGTIYDQTNVSLNTVSALRSYTFTKPTRSASTPTSASLAMKIVITDTANGSREILSVTTRAGATGQSRALPGGIETTLSEQNASNTASLIIAWGIAETRAYTYTNENTWGEEGANAPPATISTTYVQDVQVTVTASVFNTFRPFSKYNIYRTFGNNTTYIKVAPTGSGLVYTDTSRTPTSIGVALESADWVPSPTGLQGAVLMPNGWFAAFKGNTLYMSEPYKPHAWPYSMTFAGNIRGLCVAQQSIVVTFVGGVSLVVGAFPSSTQEITLATPQPGIAQRSMTNAEGGVFYASNDGLVAISGQTAGMDVSNKLFTRDTWRARYAAILQDASLRLAYHDGHLVASSANQATGFILRLDEDVGALARHDTRMDATFQLPVADTLFYSVGATIYRFRSGSNLTLDWQGKDHIFNAETAPGCGYIRCDGETRLQLYADGVLWYDTATDTLRSGEGLTTGHFRLPAGKAARRWSFRLIGAHTVHEFYLATTYEELARVHG